MWVADERKDEYLRAGHKLALESEKFESEKPTVSEETPKRKKRGK